MSHFLHPHAPSCAGSAADAATLMSEAHTRMRAAASALSAADDATFPAQLQAFVATVESDFYAEEAIMESIAYVGLREHREEHARLLAALHHIDAMVDGGNLAAGREALSLLPQWCCMHELGMDQALLHALGARASGERRAREYEQHGV